VAFITDQVLTAAVKSANTHAQHPLPAHWEDSISRANRWAYNRIRGIILGRGFTAAQFAAWGAEGEEGRDAFWLASKSDEDRGRAFSDELKEAFEELAELKIVIDGELVVPEGTGRVSHGDFDTSEDRFLLDEPEGDGAFSIGDGTRL
jgi:hypothetical protein